MWLVELNILGRKFTYRVRERAREFRSSPRAVQARLAQLRHTRYAA